jgi:hypothetical protein
MLYPFNCLRRVAICQILPHVREDGTIGQENLPAFIQPQEGAVEDPNRVATAERKMREIKPKITEFSQVYTEFQVIAADLNWNPWAPWNALRILLSEAMNDSFMYSDTPEVLLTFVTVSSETVNQIQ